MLPDKLNDLKCFLEGKRFQNSDERKLLQELNFIDSNFQIQEELEEKYGKESLFESFALASEYCPTCGKKI